MAAHTISALQIVSGFFYRNNSVNALILFVWDWMGCQQLKHTTPPQPEKEGKNALVP